ncbi:hybrid sensor histidine kinase/response regulator transcription factor [Thalassomonas haliotis]|uniref:histidine kinase n=1 Tax=Thalassomonas haliotis TaxID=485448 RepID=A0ABY7VEY9_9GAMM|nr:hybrid sensor histidine kinase/response regulator transcription factor [Thalassomonas haliotis]WDE11947.1 response regulator [Thalassomonas haliotis]
MWFATHEGLSRFDGKNFVTFQHQTGNRNSLSNNNIRALTGTEKGQLWIGTYGGGLNLLDQKTNQFSHFTFDKNDPDSLSDNRVNALFIDSQQRLWIGTSNAGLNLLIETEQGIKFKRYRAADHPGLLTDSIWSIAEDSSGRIWLGTDGGGLSILTPQSDTFVNLSNNAGDPYSLSSNSVKTIFKDHLGIMWVGTHEGGLNRYNSQSNNFSHYRFTPGDKHLEKSTSENISLSNYNIKVIHEDQQQQLWVGTDAGLNIFSPDRQVVKTIKSTRNKAGSLSHDRITAIYQDEQAILWIGTIAGLDKLKNDQLKFNHIKLSKNHLDDEKVITRFAEQADGSVMIATHGAGLSVYNKDSNSTTPFLQNEQLSDPRIISLLVDHQDNIWIGTRSAGLNVYNKQSGKMSYYFRQAENPNSLLADNIYDLFEDDEHNIWISSYKGGLSRLSPDRKTFKHYRINPGDNSGLCSDRILDIYQDGQGLLWLASESGLMKLNQKTDEIDCFQHDKNIKNSLSSNTITAIFENSQGDFLLGTLGGGINIWQQQHRLNNINHFSTITVSDGLLSNSILGIQQDEENNLWLSSKKGLSKLKPDNLIFEHFTPNDGLQSYDFFFSSTLKTSYGKLIFGGKNGFNIFTPEAISTNNKTAKVVLTNILKLHQPLASFKPYQQMRSVDFNYKDHLVTFDFIGLNYSSQKSIRYKYKLVGFDEEWVESGSHHRATYTNIPPGQYIFKVKSANGNGAWSPAYINLAVNVKAAPWKTWWAYGLYVLLSIALLSTLVFLSYQKKLAEKEKQAALSLASAKEKFFANITHEFRTPLTLMLAPGTAIEQQTGEQHTKENIALINRNAQRLLTMVEQILALARLQSEHEESRHLQNVTQVVEFLINSFQPYFQQQQIELVVANNIPKSLHLVMVPDALAKVLTNLLSNALKFSATGGVVTLSIHSDNVTSVIFEVTDFGCGIAETDLTAIFDRFTRIEDNERTVPGVGIGLALVKEIIDSHSGKIQVKSQPGAGSTFTVELPLAKQATDAEENLKQLSAAPLTTDSLLLKNNITSNIKKLQLDLKSKTPFTGLADKARDDKKTSILIIEDNLEMQSYLVSILQDSYQCHTANDGQQGVFKAQHLIPDLIISDLKMPNKDGFQVINHLKSHLTTSHIPIILLTANGNSENRNKAWQANADEYLTKPFDSTALLLRIENLLTIRKQLQVCFKQKQKTHQLTELQQHGSDTATNECSNLNGSDTPITDENKSNWLASEQLFIDRYQKIITENIADPRLKVITIAQALNMTERQLTRKLKVLLNVTPADHLRNYRLNQAMTLLKQGKSVTEITSATGFSSNSNFGRGFKAKFGVSPTHYLKTLSSNEPAEETV